MKRECSEEVEQRCYYGCQDFVSK